MTKLSLIAALPLALLFVDPAVAQTPSMCVIEGNRAIMGANMNAAFDVQAGKGCMSDISPQGTLTSSEISQRPQHGTVKMVDKDTWTYTPARGYRGPDAFAITAQGKSIDEKPGTSVLSFKVNVK
jgi:Big-like domain-containing protein